ncbi:hypothetical protein [Clostridium akagii]|uniref:hypothetical protein n=1 Tax=Clostridium akagii TaxID=91623 RepID=UPI00047DFBD8|nr:hypothetical protein [Clostridium akagii]
MIEVIYKYTCNKCGKVVEVPAQVLLNFLPPMPMIPFGWNRFNDDVICEDHLVGIMDKTSSQG